MKLVHRLIGERVRAAREHASLTQTQLSLAVGYTAANAISKLENGATSAIDIVRLARIARACNVDLVWIIDPAVQASRRVEKKRKA